MVPEFLQCLSPTFLDLLEESSIRSVASKINETPYNQAQACGVLTNMRIQGYPIHAAAHEPIREAFCPDWIPRLLIQSGHGTTMDSLFYEWIESGRQKMFGPAFLSNSPKASSNNARFFPEFMTN